MPLLRVERIVGRGAPVGVGSGVEPASGRGGRFDEGIPRECGGRRDGFGGGVEGNDGRTVVRPAGHGAVEAGEDLGKIGRMEGPDQDAVAEFDALARTGFGHGHRGIGRAGWPDDRVGPENGFAQGDGIGDRGEAGLGGDYGQQQWGEPAGHDESVDRVVREFRRKFAEAGGGKLGMGGDRLLTSSATRAY